MPVVLEFIALTEALADAELISNDYDKARTGVYIGLTEHGTVETEVDL